MIKKSLKYRSLYGTARWQRVRGMCFERDKHRCRKCGKAGRLECDHTIPMHLMIRNLTHGGQGFSDGLDPLQLEGLFYDLKRVQTLCRSCHIEKTIYEAGRARTQEEKKWQELVKGTIEL